MAKLGIIASITAIIAAFGIATFTASPASAEDPAKCVRTEFKTAMVKKACAEGGQGKAKDVMKAWNKEKNIKTCNQCHDKLAPNYTLKKDGLKQFTDLGGK